MDSKDELLRYFTHIESLGVFAGSLERAKANAAEVLDELAYRKARAWFEIAYKGTCGNG
jgi:hypothetical protein